MSRLAILEDAKRRSTRLSRDQRKKIIQLIRDTLVSREEVVLALVFGGILVDGKPVRDIDVAIYTGYRVSPDDWPAYVGEIRDMLEKRLNRLLGLVKAVDVVLLEYVQPRLRVAILRKGLVILDRAPGIRGVLLLHALDEMKALDMLKERVKKAYGYANLKDCKK